MRTSWSQDPHMIPTGLNCYVVYVWYVSYVVYVL